MRPGRRVAAAFSLVVSCAFGVAQASPSGFARVLYLHGGPPRNAELYRLIGELGFDAVNVVDGEDPAAPTRHGLGFYRDQIVGKGVLELREAQWAPVRERYERTRDASGLVRPTCLSDAGVRSALRERLSTALVALGEQRPLGICLADEPSLTRHINPLDLCFGPACLHAFRTFLRSRHDSLEALNLAWNTDYAEWEHVLPWTADRIRARELRDGELPRDLGPWSEHLEFRDRLFAEVVADLTAGVRGATNAPSGITGMQMPSAYGGYDYRLLMPHQSFYEVYDIAGARELARSVATRGALEFATLFPPAAGEPARLTTARLFDCVAHGMAGVVVWSCGEVFGAAAEPTPFGRAVAAGFERIAPVAAAFAGARIRFDPIWIVESQPSVRAHWMLDSAGDGATWVRRFSSHERLHSTSAAARESWLRLLQDLGYQPRFVFAADLPAMLPKGRPSLLVLPATIAMADVEVEAVREYVERGGGSVVADHSAAHYDERLRLRDRPALEELFSLRRSKGGFASVREGRATESMRMESGLAVAEVGVRSDVSEPVRRSSVQCEARPGRGRAAYLNLAVCEYAAVRLQPKRVAAARDLRARVRRILADAGVAPRVIAHGKGWPACLETVELENSAQRRLLAVRVNALASAELMRALGERGARDVTLEFPRVPAAVRDLRAGADLGGRRRVTLSLDPFEALLLELRD